jgi:hypothetical protein
VPKSPRTHFKEKVKDIVKEEMLNKTHVRDRSFNTRVLQAPTALGKFRSVSRKSFVGNQSRFNNQRRNTKFMEFDLSYKKSRGKDHTGGTSLVTKRNPNTSLHRFKGKRHGRSGTPKPEKSSILGIKVNNQRVSLDNDTQ